MRLVEVASGVICWSWDWLAYRADSSAGRETGELSERSFLLVWRLEGAASGLVMGLVGVANGVVCWSSDWWAQRVESSAGHGTDWRASGVAESPAGRGTGGRSKLSRLLVMRLVGAASGVVGRSGDWRVQRLESSAGLATGGRSDRSRLLVMGLAGEACGVVCWSLGWLA